MASQRTIRLERAGAVASIVLSNPPLNLFGDRSFEELGECLEEIEGSDARAAVWRAEGEIFTGGVDVHAFQRIVDAGPERASGFSVPLIETVRRLEALEIPTLATEDLQGAVRSFLDEGPGKATFQGRWGSGQ